MNNTRNWRLAISMVLLLYGCYTKVKKDEKYCQIGIKRSHLGQRKRGLLREVISKKRFISYAIFYNRTRKRWPFCTGDYLIKVTTRTGLTYIIIDLFWKNGFLRELSRQMHLKPEIARCVQWWEVHFEQNISKIYRRLVSVTRKLVSAIWLHREYFNFIVKLDIFPLMCATDNVWITELTLIHEDIKSVCYSHTQELTLILKVIGQCDIKHILTSPIK